MTPVCYNRKRDLYIEADYVAHGGALENMAKMPDGSIGAIISDPPYFVNIGRNEGKSGDLGDDPWEDVDSLQSAASWAMPMMEQAYRVVRPGGAIALMCGVHSSAAWMLAAEQAGLKWMAELMVLWNSGKPRANNFGSLNTHLLWFTRPGARHTWNSHRKSIYSNILVARKVPLGERRHISEKPIELTNFMVSLLSRPDDIVLDPFCGSGSTLVSASLANRHYIGIDKDEKHVATTNGRLMHPDVEYEHPIYFWLNNKLIEI